MLKVLIATQNEGKIREIQRMLNVLPIEILVPDTDFDVEETGITFEENALIKARAYAQQFSDLITLADDSGLEVDALQGRPGVYSKRYGSSDAERNLKLLKELEHIEAEEERTARFISAMALIGNNIDQVFRGTVEGMISKTIRGVEGFGYDPVFIPIGYKMTFAELGSEVKNTFSHRAMALNKVRKYFENIL